MTDQEVLDSDVLGGVFKRVELTLAQQIKFKLIKPPKREAKESEIFKNVKSHVKKLINRAITA